MQRQWYTFWEKKETNLQTFLFLFNFFLPKYTWKNLLMQSLYVIFSFKLTISIDKFANCYFVSYLSIINRKENERKN